MKRTILLLTILTTAAVTGRAAYRGEAGLRYGESDDDSQNYGLDLSWFIDPLTTGGPEPLAEAAFVERPRTLSVSVARTEIDLGPPDFVVIPGLFQSTPPTASLDAAPRPQANGILGRTLSHTQYGLDYVHRRPSSPHVFSLGARYAKTSLPNPIVIIDPSAPPPNMDSRTKSESHGFLCGYSYHVQPRLSVGLHAGGIWEDGNDFLDTETRNLMFDLNARWLVPLAGGMWLAIDGAIVRTEVESSIRPVSWPELEVSENFTAYYVSATFFASRKTSVGLSGSHQPDANFNSAAFNVRHFFNDRLSIGVSASRNFPEHGEETTSYTGILTCRL